MKKEFEEPMITIIMIEGDVITTSGDGTEGEGTPP